jgi:hypothetical protein
LKNCGVSGMKARHHLCCGTWLNAITSSSYQL